MNNTIHIANIYITPDEHGLGLKQLTQYGVRMPDGEERWAEDLRTNALILSGRTVVLMGTISSSSHAITLERAETEARDRLLNMGVSSSEAENYRLIPIKRNIQIIVNPSENL
jgi:hypothetical protein